MTRYYISHIWNNSSTQAGEHTSPMKKVVFAILKALGWEEIATEFDQDPELVVLISLDRSIWRLPLPDAHLFLNLLPNGGRVLFIGFDKNEQQPNVDISWFFHLGIRTVENQFTQLMGWLRDDESMKLKNSNSSFERKNLSMQFNPLKNEFSELYNWVIEHNDSLHYFYTDLYLKANQFSYDELEHDLYNKITSARDEKKYETIGETYLKKVNIDEYFDLLEGLRYARYYKERIQNKKVTKENGCKLLLIDDYPEKYKDKIKAVLEAFGIEIDVHTLKVANGSGNAELCNKLSKYNSAGLIEQFKEESQLEKFLISSENGTKQIEMDVTALFEYDTILVDLLMPDDREHKRVIGVNIIRGLRRLATDLSKDIPDIIAFSLADDIRKIQEALRAGAEAYVTKTRILSLPGTLGRLGTDQHKPSTYARRNFRSLYQLPEETRRLLQQFVIPKVRFDRAELGLDKKQENEIAKAQLVASFLQRIPKPDIHVHVGSCMSPEFLVVASLVMLLRQKDSEKISKPYEVYADFWTSKCKYQFIDALHLKGKPELFEYHKKNERGINNLATAVKSYLLDQIDREKNFTSSPEFENKFRQFRSIIHNGLGIPGHWNIERLINAINKLSDIELFLFIMVYGGPYYEDKKVEKPDLKKDDIIRLFLLFQAANGYPEVGILKLDNKEENFLDWFILDNNKAWEQWKALHKLFYSENNKDSEEDRKCLKLLRMNNWQLDEKTQKIRCSISLKRNTIDNVLAQNFIFKDDPITYLLATGTRCNNLVEYLEGCEFSGAEHLRHPWLIHLYAQQTVFQFVQQGLLYAELRAAVSGYENNAIRFSFQDACSCMQAAFGNAMEVVKHEVREESLENNYWLWGEESDFSQEKMNPFFPIKVGLTLTGKRHKPIRQLLREASAAIVFQSFSEGNLKTAHEFVNEGLTTCHFVGFDLAGPEEDFPPELFSTEFGQISRMHIPITIHSGENAPPSYVENAVIDLGAKRIGHGLSLAEDTALMNRLREDRICIELCPCSNFQTNPLVPHGEQNGWVYPLRKYLEKGNAICINTDNPIISGTNIIKECFQASWAYGGDGLTLWNLLRILRMGFIHSFMSVPDRRAMLELADQILFDLFMDEANVERLRIININK